MVFRTGHCPFCTSGCDLGFSVRTLAALRTRLWLHPPAHLPARIHDLARVAAPGDCDPGSPWPTAGICSCNTKCGGWLFSNPILAQRGRLHSPSKHWLDSRGQQFSVSDPGSGSGKLDYAYLGTLSDDAVPALESAYRQSRLDEDSQLTQQLATTLTCHFKIVNQPGETPWQSWNRSRQAALSSWNFLKADPGFPIIEITEGNTFTFSGEELSCFGPAWD